MSNKPVYSTILFIVLVGMLGVASRVQRVEAQLGTIYIRADGSIDPPTPLISSVDNVTYTFTDNINGSIVVERNNIVVDGAGYTLQGTGSVKGIDLTGRNNVTIKNMEIRGFHVGIGIYSSSNNNVSNNRITANVWYGISLSSSDNNIFISNNVTNNRDAVNFWNSSNNLLRGNLLDGNQWGFRFYGDDLGDYMHTIDTSNLVDGKPVHYLINQHGITINPSTHPEIGFLALVNSTSITVEGLNLTNNGQGLLIACTNNTEIQNNNITNNRDGIYVACSFNNTISENNIKDNIDVGIGLYYSFNNNISRNNITNNLGEDGGIDFDYSSNNTISGNNLKANSYSISLRHSNYSVIYGNNITNNVRGINLDSSSNNNTFTRNNVECNSVGISIGGSLSNVISGNNVVNNTNGIDIVGVLFTIISRNHIAENNQYGIILDAASNNTLFANNITNNNLGIFLDGLCNNNTVYHNNFVNNTQQVVVSLGDVNAWDNGYPSGGNYWSDYNGTDFYSGPHQNITGSDGIGDASYFIDANNTDRYPLMGPTSFFDAGTWNEVTYYIHTASNSTVSNFYFSKDDKLVGFNVNGTSDTVGYCRATIPRELMWCDSLEEWNFTINGNTPTYLKAMNDSDYTYLYFTYNHSIKEVQIKSVHVIPEFTSSLILPLFIIATLLTAILLKKTKHLAQNKRIK